MSDKEYALRIARLWRAGKMIGGDEDEVRDTLLSLYEAQSLELQRITSDRDAKSARMWELGKLCDEQAAELQAVREALQAMLEHAPSMDGRIVDQAKAALKPSRGA